MNKGEYQDFSYTGNIQTFTIPNTAVYKLEVWGGQGGSASYYSGGQGGYSVGYKKLKKGTIIYVGVGGAGGNAGSGYAGSGGYNGGGGGYWSQHEAYWDTYCAGGGGATHIALVTGTLASIGSTSFATNGLIVAGGGGGGAVGSNSCYGNTGGGTTGGGGSFGQGTTGYDQGPDNYTSAGGGGGYAGGDCGHNSSANGGTGFIGNVDNFKTYTKSTTNGGNTGNGKAKLTLMKKCGAILGTKDCEVYLGDKDMSGIYLGTKEVG